MLKRRSILGLLIAGFTSLPGFAADPCGRGSDSFPCKFNRWAMLVKSKQHGTVDVAEIQAWLDVKATWREVEAEVNRYYNL